MDDKISVLIVEDSLVDRKLLSYIVESDPQIILLGCVTNGLEALDFIKRKTPDVILMDIYMPHMDGLEATRQIMRTRPIPIIICTADYKAFDVNKSFEALEAGALAILEKPKGVQDPKFESILQSYINMIKNAAEVKLVTRLKSKPPSKKTASLSNTPLQASGLTLEAVAIGASLGGPQALQQILSRLSPGFPVPIYIVQHITEGFTAGFVEWLKTETKLKIVIAADKEKAKPGYVYVAPDNKHLTLAKGGIIKLVNRSSSELLCPSVSKLFNSMADVYGEKAVGIILTGMGRDGVNELLTMKNRGAVTIAQSEENCVMFGMPQEAINIGAASFVVPLERIPNFLAELFFPAK